VIARMMLKVAVGLLVVVWLGWFAVWQNLLNNMAHMHLSLSQRPLMAIHVYPRTEEVCWVSSGNPNHLRSSEQDHITKAL
jgi:hypothetical protein